MSTSTKPLPMFDDQPAETAPAGDQPTIHADIDRGIALAGRQRHADANEPGIFMLSPEMMSALRRARTIVGDSQVATVVTNALARALADGTVSPDAADEWTRNKLSDCEDAARILQEIK